MNDIISTTTSTFVVTVDPGTQNVIEDPQSYFILIHQVSLPVDFWYFATYDLNLKIRQYENREYCHQ